MIGLTSLEVYNSVFFITEENSEFQLYTDTFDELSFAELEDELEDTVDFSNVTDTFDELSFAELDDELEEIVDFSNVKAEHLQEEI